MFDFGLPFLWLKKRTPRREINAFDSCARISISETPDQTFHNFKPSKSICLRILRRSETSIGKFWSSKIVKCWSGEEKRFLWEDQFRWSPQSHIGFLRDPRFFYSQGIGRIREHEPLAKNELYIFIAYGK